MAVIGPSGSGKSTLAALALKVAAPQAGRVLLGGVDASRLAAVDVRAGAAWLTGDASFDDSIRENLLLARPGADEAALWQARRRPPRRVRARPADGLDSWLARGRAGIWRSGARLALAGRCCRRRSCCCWTSRCAGLDAETERAFFATLNEGGRAHRADDRASADRGGAAGPDLPAVGEAAVAAAR